MCMLSELHLRRLYRLGCKDSTAYTLVYLSSSFFFLDRDVERILLCKDTNFKETLQYETRIRLLYSNT